MPVDPRDDTNFKNRAGAASVPTMRQFFSALGITAVCLANNHILDYGEGGVKETLATFTNAGIRTVGAGACLEGARSPLLHRFSCGRSLGVVSMAESEFCIAEKDSAGANPIDFTNYSMIENLKISTDKILVILHAGTEMRRFPRPGLIDLCHFLVDQGTDAVLFSTPIALAGWNITIMPRLFMAKAISSLENLLKKKSSLRYGGRGCRLNWFGILRATTGRCSYIHSCNDLRASGSAC